MVIVGLIINNYNTPFFQFPLFYLNFYSLPNLKNFPIHNFFYLFIYFFHSHCSLLSQHPSLKNHGIGVYTNFSLSMYIPLSQHPKLIVCTNLSHTTHSYRNIQKSSEPRALLHWSAPTFHSMLILVAPSKSLENHEMYYDGRVYQPFIHCTYFLSPHPSFMEQEMYFSERVRHLLIINLPPPAP